MATPMPKHSEILLQESGRILATPHIKQFVVNCIISDIWKVVDIALNAMCQRRDCTPPIIHHNIFEWSYEAFVQRIQSNRLYIEELYKIDSRSLTTLKFSTAFRCLKDLLQLFHNGSMDVVLTQLNNCKKLQHILEEFSHTHMLELDILRQLTDEDNMFHKLEEITMNRITTNMFSTIDECNDVTLVGDPILLRYQHKYMNVEMEMKKFKLDLSVARAEANIRSFTQSSVSKMAISETTQGYFQNEIMELRQRIQMWTEKYDRDYEQVCEVEKRKKWQLQTLAAKWQEHKESMQFFRKEIQQRLEQDRLALELQMQYDAEQQRQRELQRSHRKSKSSAKKRSKK